MAAHPGAAIVGRMLLAVALIGPLVACETSATPTVRSLPRPTAAFASPDPAELAALRDRPLRLPALAGDEACPVTPAAPPDPPPPPGHPLARCDGRPASALGRAPVFPDARYFHGEADQVYLQVRQADAGGYAAKVPWSSREGYRGWVLIRIARLDGPGTVSVELQIAGGRTTRGDAIGVNVTADWQFWPGGTEASDAGCYAYQVDGSNFSEIILFRVVVAP